MIALFFVWYNQTNDVDLTGGQLLLKPCEKEYLNGSAIGIFMGTIVLADITAILVGSSLSRTPPTIRALGLP